MGRPESRTVRQGRVPSGASSTARHGPSTRNGPDRRPRAHQRIVVEAGATAVLRLRLRLGSATSEAGDADPFAGFEATFATRIAEADAFYAAVGGDALNDDERLVQRQAFAGLIWCKQFYHYDVNEWLDGDPANPPPASRRVGRNAEWREFNSKDILSMPDNWEYPWFAAWDLAFHCVALAVIDPAFAKAQLLLLTREWYMHPNGQLPAYEWRFGDVNPPVHAWAAWRVYQIDRRQTGKGDLHFLERVFHKLLLNFTWWVNRKDLDGANVFQGGFLGLDNIGLFDRDAPLPGGAHLGQADGTAWMGMFCLNMLAIALELAQDDLVYEDIATKFFEHFLYIAGALNNLGGSGVSLWNEEDGFYYDAIHFDSGDVVPLRIRSMVGLIPLLAVHVLEPEVIADLPDFRRRMRWFLTNRPELARHVASWTEPGVGERRLLSLVHGDRLRRITKRLVDPDEFLSPHGIRSLSREHLAAPVSLTLPGGQEYMIGYEPAESQSGLFGGNSNWRGPVWFPINYLLIEAYLTFHHYHGGSLTVEMPYGSGQHHELDDLAWDLSDRLVGLFVRDAVGPAARPRHGLPPPARSGLGRPDPVLRVLRRRQRARCRGEPPDRLDGARRQAPRADGPAPAVRGGRRPRATIQIPDRGRPEATAPERLPRDHCQRLRAVRDLGCIDASSSRPADQRADWPR